MIRYILKSKIDIMYFLKKNFVKSFIPTGYMPKHKQGYIRD